MRPLRFLLTVGFITFISCLYVYQQTEILRLAYIGQKKKAALQDSLDKNSFLRYNLEKSISLVRIGEGVSQAAGFQMPKDYRTVRVASLQKGLTPGIQKSKKESIASRIFSIKRQAEAKTIP